MLAGIALQPSKSGLAMRWICMTDLYDQCMSLPGEISQLATSRQVLFTPNMSGPRMLDTKPAPTLDKNRRQPRRYLSDRTANAGARRTRTGGLEPMGNDP